MVSMEMADRVEGGEVESCEHFVIEEQPKDLRGDYWICFKRWSRDSFRRGIE